MTDIEKLKELEAKATKGPWSTHLVDDTTIMSPAREVATTCDSSQTDREDGYDIEYEQMEADAALIVAMRNALPTLLNLATRALSASGEDEGLCDLLEAMEHNAGTSGEQGTACWLRNPDGPAAAACIRTLSAQLSAALERAEKAEGERDEERRWAERYSIGDAETRRAIGDRFCLVLPDGGDVKTWEAAADMRNALEAAESRALTARADALREAAVALRTKALAVKISCECEGYGCSCGNSDDAGRAGADAAERDTLLSAAKTIEALIPAPTSAGADNLKGGDANASREANDRPAHEPIPATSPGVTAGASEGGEHE